MRRMLCLGAAVLVGGAAFVCWHKSGPVEVAPPTNDGTGTAAFTSPVLTPQFVAKADRVEADEPIVVERPAEQPFTAFPLFDAVPGIVQANGEALPPRPDQETAPRMPEVAD